MTVPVLLKRKEVCHTNVKGAVILINLSCMATVRAFSFPFSMSIGRMQSQGTRRVARYAIRSTWRKISYVLSYAQLGAQTPEREKTRAGQEERHVLTATGIPAVSWTNSRKSCVELRRDAAIFSRSGETCFIYRQVTIETRSFYSNYNPPHGKSSTFII